MRLAQQMGGRVGGGAVTPLTNGSCVPSYRSQSTSTVVLFPLLPCTAIISSHVIYWVKSPQRSRSPRLCMHRRPWPPWPSAALHSAFMSTGEKKQAVTNQHKSTDTDVPPTGCKRKVGRHRVQRRHRRLDGRVSTHTHRVTTIRKNTHTHAHLWVQFINKTFHVIKGSFLDFFFGFSSVSLWSRGRRLFFSQEQVRHLSYAITAEL